MRFDHRCQIRDPLVDIELGVEALPVPDQAHEALQPEADACRGMGFGDRNIDQYGIVEYIRENLHPLQNLSLRDTDLAEEFSVLQGKDVDTGNVTACIPDSRPIKAEFRPLQRMIQDENLLCPRIHTGTGHRYDYLGMRRCGEIGRLGKRHIRFDDHALPLFHEARDSSHDLQSLAGCGGRFTGNHGEIHLPGRTQERGIAGQADGHAGSGRYNKLPSRNDSVIVNHDEFPHHTIYSVGISRIRMMSWIFALTSKPLGHLTWHCEQSPHRSAGSPRETTRSWAIPKFR